MIYKDVRYGKKSVEKLDIYVENSENTVIYLHGGGLTDGDKSLNDYLKEMIKRGFSVVSVDYSMYPDAKFPDFIEDCADALSFVKKNATKYGYGEKICVVGCSAGAYISLMLYFDEKYLGKYGLSAADFHGFLIDSAQPTSHFNVLKERGEPTYAVRVDETAPIYFLKNKDYGAKLFLITYNDDMFCRKEQNEMFDKTLISYNVPHEFFLLDGTHCSGESVDGNGDIRLVSITEKLFK